MYIFSKEGRAAYLAFVRNLPSQIVLLSPCFFLPRLKAFNWTETLYVTLWLIFLSMFIFAATANFLELIESSSDKEANRARVAGLRFSGLSGWRLTVKQLRLITLGEWVGFIIVMLVVYGGLALVVAMVFWSVFPKA